MNYSFFPHKGSLSLCFDPSYQKIGFLEKRRVFQENPSFDTEYRLATAYELATGKKPPEEIAEQLDELIKDFYDQFSEATSEAAGEFNEDFSSPFEHMSPVEIKETVTQINNGSRLD